MDCVILTYLPRSLISSSLMDFKVNNIKLKCLLLSILLKAYKRNRKILIK